MKPWETTGRMKEGIFKNAFVCVWLHSILISTYNDNDGCVQFFHKTVNEALYILLKIVLPSFLPSFLLTPLPSSPLLPPSRLPLSFLPSYLLSFLPLSFFQGSSFIWFPKVQLFCILDAYASLKPNIRKEQDSCWK